MTEAELNCPLCQQLNNCGVNSTEPCWCMAEKVPTELIEQVPTSERNKSCICAKCVDKFNQLAKSIR